VSLSFSNLTSGQGTAATSFTTASVAPAGNQLLLLAVSCRVATGSIQPPTPTITGNGLTWELVDATNGHADYDATGVDRSTLFLFRSMGVSPSSGTIVIDFVTMTLTQCDWALDQSSAEVDTSGTNGSGAVVQTAKNEAGNNVNTLTVTLAAFGDAVNNAAYGAFSHQHNSEATSPGAGFTELVDVAPTGNLCTLETEWVLGQDTSVDASWATATNRSGGIAVEVKAAAGGAAPTSAIGATVRRGPGHRRGPLGRMDLLRAYHRRHRSTEIPTAAALAVDQTDDVGLTDSVEFVQQLERTDSAGLTDTTAFTEALERTDSAGLTDTSTVELVKLLTQTDDVGLTDSVLFTESLVRTDSAGLTDSALIQQELVRTDSVGLTDSNVRELVKLVTQTDDSGLTDAAAFIEQLVRTDSAGLTDTTALTEALGRTDSAGLTDTAVVGLQKDITQTDSAGLVDTAAFVQVLARTDDSGLTDSAELGGTAGTAITPKAALIELGTRAFAGIEPAIRAGAGAELGTRTAAAVVIGVKASVQIEPGAKRGPNVEEGV
jgi:hypothetical protein